MSYVVKIKKNDTGEIREVTFDLEWQNSSLYAWTDGNFGCDCNRAIFFHEWAKNETDYDDTCGDSRYTAVEAILQDGRIKRIEGND
jgi:hypothetical protein